MYGQTTHIICCEFINFECMTTCYCLWLYVVVFIHNVLLLWTSTLFVRMCCLWYDVSQKYVLMFMICCHFEILVICPFLQFFFLNLLCCEREYFSHGYPFTLSGNEYSKNLYWWVRSRLMGTGMRWLCPYPYPAGAIPKSRFLKFHLLPI
jgi:hypothetical protein